MTILRLLIACMITTSAFAAGNAALHDGAAPGAPVAGAGEALALEHFEEDVIVLQEALSSGAMLVAEHLECKHSEHYPAALSIETASTPSAPVVTEAPALKRFEEDVRVLHFHSPGAVTLVAERINYHDPMHYEAAKFLDAISQDDETSFIQLSLSYLFPQYTGGRWDGYDDEALSKIRDISQQAKSFPFQHYIVFSRTGMKKEPVGTFRLALLKMGCEKALLTPLTIFLRKEYRGRGVASGMFYMLHSLVSKMLHMSVLTMNDKWELSWSDSGLEGWIAMVARVNYPSLGLFLRGEGTGVGMTSDCQYAHIIWPASMEEQTVANELRGYVCRKQVEYKTIKAKYA